MTAELEITTETGKLSVRLPEELVLKVKEYANTHGLSVSDVLKGALAQFFSSPGPVPPPPEQLDELKALIQKLQSAIDGHLKEDVPRSDIEAMQAYLGLIHTYLESVATALQILLAYVSPYPPGPFPLPSLPPPPPVGGQP